MLSGTMSPASPTSVSHEMTCPGTMRSSLLNYSFQFRIEQNLANSEKIHRRAIKEGLNRSSEEIVKRIRIISDGRKEGD